jgi:hypothetical protein
MPGPTITASCRIQEGEKREMSQAMLTAKSSIPCAGVPAPALLPSERRRGAAVPASMAWLLVALVIVIAARSGPAEAAAARTVTLDFEGIRDYNQIGNFHGPGGGAGPAKNYGIIFGLSGYAMISDDDLINLPSPSTAWILATDPTDDAVHDFMTVIGGFTALSFQYVIAPVPNSLIVPSITVTVFAGPDRTGAVLGTVLLPEVESDDWGNITVPFSCGVARSVEFLLENGKVVLIDDMVIELAATRPARLSHKGKKGTTKRCMKSMKAKAM